jgi:hypothetical protein
MSNLNEHIKRMKQLFNSEHGIIKPLVSEQIEDEFDDLITKGSGSKPNGDNTTPINADRKANPNYKNANDSFEDKDDMVNKPGSGKGLISSIDATINNLTKGTSEVVKLNFKKDTDYNYLSSFLDGITGAVADDIRNSYGYVFYGETKGDKYGEDDSLLITINVPLILKNSEINHISKNVISNVNTSISGKNTKVSINCKTVESTNTGGFLPVVLSYKVDQDASPFGGDSNCDLVLRFR